MESAIRLCYNPLLNPQLSLFNGPKGSAHARASRFHPKFNHATLSLSRFSTRHPVARSFGHVNCTHNKFYVPSEEEGSDNKILRGVTGVSVVLACVVGLLNLSSKLNPKYNIAYANSSESSPHVLQRRSGLGGQLQLPGGEDALDSVLNIINAKQQKYKPPPRFEEDQPPSTAKVEELKLYAVGLSKSGKKGEEKALKVLENEYKKYKEHGQVELDLEKALIELLLVQGKFQEANKLLDSRIDQKPSPDDPTYQQLTNEDQQIHKLLKSYKSDTEPSLEKLSTAQILLYKAIIQTMLENNTESTKRLEDLRLQGILHMLKNKKTAKWWAAFIRTLEGNE